jgi:hypothetical protein
MSSREGSEAGETREGFLMKFSPNIMQEITETERASQ